MDAIGRMLEFYPVHRPPIRALIRPVARRAARALALRVVMLLALALAIGGCAPMATGPRGAAPPAARPTAPPLPAHRRAAAARRQPVRLSAAVSAGLRRRLRERDRAPSARTPRASPPTATTAPAGRTASRCAGRSDARGGRAWRRAAARLPPEPDDEAVPIASRRAARPRRARADLGRARRAEALPAARLDGRRGVVPVPRRRARARVVRDRAGPARLRQERLAAAGLLVRRLHRRPRGAARCVRAGRGGPPRRPQPRRQRRAALRGRAPGARPHAWSRSTASASAPRSRRRRRRRSRNGSTRSRDPQDFATYASFDAVADRLQKNNPRLPRDKALFLARHWAEGAAGRARAPRLRSAAQAAVPDRLPDRGNVRGVAQHRGADAVGRRGGFEHPEVARRPSRGRGRAPTASPASGGASRTSRTAGW